MTNRCSGAILTLINVTKGTTMSQQLQNFFLSVQKMPHWANQHSSGKHRVDSHEEALAVELTAQGYVEEKLQSKKTPKKQRKYPNLGKKALLAAIDIEDPVKRQAAIAKLVQGMAKGSFIRQPAGGQSFPDFLICDFSGTFVVVEAKSGNGAAPTWNDSLPREGCIYIMSSGKHSGSTFWLGEDWISANERAIFKQLYATIDKIVKEANNKLYVINQNTRGFQYYNRKKHDQKGSAIYTDPFVHTDRIKCEQNVLAFALAQ